MAEAESVQLFLDRARRQQPRFELAPLQAPALAELCIRLDGIPLALELAAARVSSLTIEQVNAHLSDRFRLLTGGARTARPHQQTLRGTFDWSHGLLPDAERIAWRRLAVFPGGFTLDAAAYVALESTADATMAVDRLEYLVAHSLVVADTRGAGACYRLLETTRAYGLEKLSEAGETAAVRRRHAEFVCRQFEPAPFNWWRMPEMEWRAIYVTELGNVRAALDWAFDTGGDPDLGVALAGASGAIWPALSLLSEGARRLETATRGIQPASPEPDLARLWLWFGIMLQDSVPKKSLTAVMQADALYRRVGDAFGTADAQLRLALNFARMGRHDDATHALAAAYPEVERSGLPKMMAIHCATLAQIKLNTGHLADARLLYERAGALFRDAMSEFGELSVLANLANVCWALGELEAAESTFLDHVKMLRSSLATRHYSLGFTLCNLSGVLTERGELERALAAAREGLPLLRDAGNTWVFADHLALRAALAGHGTHAARIAGYADAIRAHKQAPREPTEARARKRLQALLLERMGPSELEQILADGTRLGEDDVCRLALAN
jgi:predicted ATPase